MFSPLSELKVPGSNLDRFSLFIFYDGEVSWYFSCVYTYPIFFFSFFFMIYVYLWELTVSQVLIHIEGLRNKYLDH